MWGHGRWRGEIRRRLRLTRGAHATSDHRESDRLRSGLLGRDYRGEVDRVVAHAAEQARAALVQPVQSEEIQPWLRGHPASLDRVAFRIQDRQPHPVQGRLVAGEDGASGDVVTAYRRAVVSGYSGGTAGNAVYVAEGTDYGEITETQPTTSGDCDTIIGYVASATVAALEPGSRADSTAA